MRSKIKTWFYDTQNAGKSLKVASVTLSIDQEPETNLKAIASRVDELLESHPDIELVVFGEMLLGWFNPGKMPEYHQSIARPFTEETLSPFISRAIRYGVYICFGMPELDGSSRYNSQVLINPQGEIQAVHRKKHLKPDEHKANYLPGQVPVTITEIKGIKTGIVICSDAANPNTIRELMKSRLDLILLSLADDQDDDLFMAKLNARMYDAWVVSANRYGEEDGYFWNGHMVISDPLGTLSARSQDKAGFLLYDLKFETKQGAVKRILRNIVVKISLVVHLLANFKRLQDYR